MYRQSPGRGDAAVRRRQFLLGEYDVAVFVAMREVEIRVRDLAGASDSDLGTKLIDKAFAPGIPGVLVDPKTEPGEQQAMLIPSGRQDQSLRRISGAHVFRFRSRVSPYLQMDCSRAR
ncbi:TIGR02391 family protein [Amycolatopsis sp. cmx-8-4]|uniref:TIGR02391 family protein n=1 Tax=Amycolatopsis sp. cmx-8-4 TaxID=2790947 RepID=UPI00397DDF70